VTPLAVSAGLSEAQLPFAADEELAGPPHRPAPVKRAERISSVDVLRGFALLGILVVNVDSFAGPEGVHDIPLASAFVGPHAHWNLIALFLKWIFIEGKMRALFSMLFGAGVILLTSRAEKRGAGAQIADIYLRRNMWLLALGLLHGVFLWGGDILFLYAFCALFFLYPCRHLKARTLFLAGSIALLAGYTYSLLNHYKAFDDFSLSRSMAGVEADQRAGKQLTPAQQKIQKAWKARVADNTDDPQETQQEIDESRKGYLADLTEHGLNYVNHQARVIAAGGFIEVLGCMLIGMALFKSGFLSAELSYGFYLATAAAGFLISVPLYIVGLWKAYASGFFFLTINQWIWAPYTLAEEAGALAIAATLLILIKSGKLRPMLRPFAAVGQTALTNYLLTSLLCQILFRWSPWHLFGKLEYYQYNLVVLGVWSVNLTLSPLWLWAFQFGPVEWLWRSLTYWKLQPMRVRS
jgi:uncharacterized protein